MENNNTQVSTGLSYSYIHCIDNYLTFFTHSLFPSLPYIDEESAHLAEELKAIFLSLPTVLSEGSDIKEAYALKLVSFRPLLEAKYRVLKAYERELLHLTTRYQTTTLLSDEELRDLHLQESDLVSMDFNQLASDCTRFIFEIPKMTIKQERAAALLPYIPIKITKENYLYYIDKSIKQIVIDETPGSAQLLVSILRQLFNGTTCPGYGQHFKDIVDSLAELSQFDNREDFEENTELLQEMIDSLLKMLYSMYHIVCNLCNLFILDTLDFKTLTDMHPSFYDLYYSVKGLLTPAEDKELFLSTLPERVEDIKNSLQGPYEKACSSKKTSSVFALIQTYLSMDLQHLFGFDIKKHNPYNDQTNSTLNQFLEELRDELFALPAVDRKLRMQYFMSTIPFVMSEDTFLTYTKKAFSAISKPKQSLVAAMYLSNILEENNFFTNPETEHVLMEQGDDDYSPTTDASYHHDCHDEDCDCEHDHHHP